MPEVWGYSNCRVKTEVIHACGHLSKGIQAVELKSRSCRVKIEVMHAFGD